MVMGPYHEHHAVFIMCGGGGGIYCKFLGPMFNRQDRRYIVEIARGRAEEDRGMQ
jgi:hypothetical protein